MAEAGEQEQLIGDDGQAAGKSQRELRHLGLVVDDGGPAGATADEQGEDPGEAFSAKRAL